LGANGTEGVETKESQGEMGEFFGASVLIGLRWTKKRLALLLGVVLGIGGSFKGFFWQNKSG